MSHNVTHKTRLAMAIHCHQPVFNFEDEFKKAFEHAYDPLVKTFYAFPDIKASFHFSGGLLEWLERNRPATLDKIKDMIRRGQIEMMGGACYEPVLSLIPKRDREDQISMNTGIIKRIFNTIPTGAWIGERVWDQGISDNLIDSGIKYTIVDDNHLLRSGIGRKDVFRPFTTKGEKGEVTLFPANRTLRYIMPFRPPEEVVEYLKKTSENKGAGPACFFFADDGEKFGAWPHTYRMVQKSGWLERFFSLIMENGAWLKTYRYDEIAKEVSPASIPSVRSSSYAEMQDWSEGDFNNFLRKYPEADRMHKRMVSVSRMIEHHHPADGEEDLALKEARKELFKAQTGCAYWHGTFGGVYLPNLREGVYRHLIKAQNLVNSVNGSERRRALYSTRMEKDQDKSEWVLESDIFGIFTDPAKGGAINEIDHKPSNVNITNTFSRVREKYHRKLDRDYMPKIRTARRAFAMGGIADVHDILGVGERGLKKLLFYDDHPRRSFLTHIYAGARIPWKELSRGAFDADVLSSGEYDVWVESDEEGYLNQSMRKRGRVWSSIDNDNIALDVEKRITIGHGPAIMLTHRLTTEEKVSGVLGCVLEFNFLIWDTRAMGGPRKTRTDRISLRDEYSGLTLDLFLDRPLPVLKYPIFTVNETEKGLKKTFQGISIMVGDEAIRLKGRSEHEIRISLAIG